MIDHRGERRRLSRTRGTDDEHETALRHHDFLERVRQPELLEIRNLVGDRSNHHPNVLLLDENVDAEPRNARHGDREVALQVARELIPLARIHERRGQQPGDFARELLRGEGLHLPRALSCSGGKSFEMNKSEPPA